MLQLQKHGLLFKDFHGHANQKPHKAYCEILSIYMKDTAETAILQSYFPWLVLSEFTKTFDEKGCLAKKCITGFGYWYLKAGPTPHSSDATHQVRLGQHMSENMDAFNASKTKFPGCDIFYENDMGALLKKKTFPNEKQSWELQDHEIPCLHFTDRTYRPTKLFPRLLSSHPEYYAWRGLSASSISALLMEFPLSLYLCIVKNPKLMAKSSLVVHLVGAEKEMKFLPIFAELVFLLPHRNIDIRFVGHEVVKVASEASPCALANKPGFVYEYTSPDWYDSDKHTLRISLETTHGNWYDMIRAGTDGFPDMVFAPNSGIASYPQWQSVIDTCLRANIFFATTEYCQRSLDLSERIVRGITMSRIGVISSDIQITRFLNPFRNPGQRDIPIARDPNFSNGYILLVM